MVQLYNIEPACADRYLYVINVRKLGTYISWEERAALEEKLVTHV
jgi:hypothetical protein